MLHQASKHTIRVLIEAKFEQEDLKKNILGFPLNYKRKMLIKEIKIIMKINYSYKNLEKIKT